LNDYWIVCFISIIVFSDNIYQKYQGIYDFDGISILDFDKMYLFNFLLIIFVLILSSLSSTTSITATSTSSTTSSSTSSSSTSASQQHTVITDERFFQAARVGDIKVLLEYIDAGGDINSRDAKGNSALVIASGRGMVEVLKLLLKHGAYIEDATSIGLFEGKTALCWAASQGRAEAVALLVQAGANPQKPMDRGVFLGKNALHWAASQGRTEVVRILIAAGVDVNYASSIGNFKGKNALMWASSQGRFETVVLLLEAGTNVNAVDNDGVSALMWASGSEAEEEGHKRGLFEKATKGHIDVVRWLLKYGSEPDLRDNDGITAIMYACYHGHDGAVEILLNAGADASYENKAGKNALQLASSAGFAAAAEAVKRGPSILTLPVEEMVQISTCGWLVNVLRLPLGTGIYPKAVTKNKNNYNLENSCITLKKNGLDDSLGDTLALIDDSSIDDVVKHLGLPNFASNVRAKTQLIYLYQKVKNATSSIDVDVGGDETINTNVN